MMYWKDCPDIEAVCSSLFLKSLSDFTQISFLHIELQTFRDDAPESWKLDDILAISVIFSLMKDLRDVSIEMVETLEGEPLAAGPDDESVTWGNVTFQSTKLLPSLSRLQSEVHDFIQIVWVFEECFVGCRSSLLTPLVEAAFDDDVALLPTCLRVLSLPDQSLKNRILTFLVRFLKINNDRHYKMMEERWIEQIFALCQPNFSQLSPFCQNYFLYFLSEMFDEYFHSSPTSTRSVPQLMKDSVFTPVRLFLLELLRNEQKIVRMESYSDAQYVLLELGYCYDGLCFLSTVVGLDTEFEERMAEWEVEWVVDLESMEALIPRLRAMQRWTGSKVLEYPHSVKRKRMLLSQNGWKDALETRLPIVGTRYWVSTELWVAEILFKNGANFELTEFWD
ncbi:hypothetical protein BLNAU_23843 [Blattamonas nauphoetae]|uniref:Uncharacterized protein n=1 Tax=Blattamonas nauphoetae TaxID=2049346 RepID=A0ABQ9WS06_9EUKA|nr:hypothetical protein BLNAU_23843 [Blattamonas nauphoetae]